MRLGLFGGSFDPVHYGHLLLAECCREQCALDAVWFAPAAVPPHKLQAVLAPAADRIEMLKLAISGYQPFAAYSGEIERGGVSYTVDTLEQLQREDSQRELFLLMGADSLADLPTWKDPGRICELATLAVVQRAGSAKADYSILAPFVSAERIEAFANCRVEMPLVEISSSEIRNRVAAGRSIRFRTPRAVERYIETHGLYRVESEGVIR